MVAAVHSWILLGALFVCLHQAVTLESCLEILTLEALAPMKTHR